MMNLNTDQHNSTNIFFWNNHHLWIFLFFPFNLSGNQTQCKKNGVQILFNKRCRTMKCINRVDGRKSIFLIWNMKIVKICNWQQIPYNTPFMENFFFDKNRFVDVNSVFFVPLCCCFCVLWIKSIIKTNSFFTLAFNRWGKKPDIIQQPFIFLHPTTDKICKTWWPEFNWKKVSFFFTLTHMKMKRSLNNFWRVVIRLRGMIGQRKKMVPGLSFIRL